MRHDRHHRGPHDEPHAPDHPHRHGRGRRGGGPGRFFESADLRFVILHLIADAPRHGYEIIKLIEDLMSGAHAPSPGIVYPTLTMLEEMGLAAVTVDGSRKLYSLTDEGRRELEAHRAETDAILQRLRQIGERHAGGRSRPILRAMENLRLVLRMREQWTAEQLAAATDILDNAARAIEKL